MKLRNINGCIYVPDGTDEDKAIARTTHMAIAAHQDDIEISCFAPILECYDDDEKFFTGVTVTDGAGSPRNGEFAAMTDEEMKKIRIKEQNEAAKIGRYSAQLQLGYSSKQVKDGNNTAPVEEIAKIIEAAAPRVLYIHNLADKHDTHLAVALRTIAAVRSLPIEKRPEKIICFETWRGLDWVDDDEKVIMKTENEKLGLKLLGVFKSQIAGGKRYDLATAGRWLANATFFASHSVDSFNAANYGIDITDAVNEDKEPEEIIGVYIRRFADGVYRKLNELK